jgi:hypothetical protein
MSSPRFPAIIFVSSLLVVFTSVQSGVAGSDAASSARRQLNQPARSGEISNLNAEQSTNWSGYGITAGPLGFSSVQGTWKVPAVARSKADTASSTWTGIGGNCTNSSCTTQDPTLIQAGTEQDNVSGKPSYYAWWEAIPAPSVQAGGTLSSQNYDVRPGDVITTSIVVANGADWTIQISDMRRGVKHWTFNTTVPYSSAGLTAEWIEESPLTAGSGGAGQIALSNFHRVLFGNITANGADPHLGASDAIVLTDGSGHILARQSAPKASGNSFAICYGSGTCR